jgi:hypothetical protein
VNGCNSESEGSRASPSVINKDRLNKFIPSLLCSCVKEIEIFNLAIHIYISLPVSCRPHATFMFKSSVNIIHVFSHVNIQ